MTLNELVSETITPLAPADTAEHALALMDEFRVSHLPIVDGNLFQGLISEADIHTHNSTLQPVINHPLSLGLTCIRESQHVFDAIALFSSLSLSVLPVVDENNRYFGSITALEMTRRFAQLFALNNPGGIIILEMNEKDFCLTEIANIIESNDAKVLSMTTNSHPDSTKLEITLKLNRMDIAPVLQSFQRYNYSIQASFSENLNTDTMMERFNSLMKYLNI